MLGTESDMTIRGAGLEWREVGFSASAVLDDIRTSIESSGGDVENGPTALREELERTIRGIHGGPRSGEPLILAFSGGVDSALLLSAFEGDDRLAGLLVLTTSESGRDFVSARSAARFAGRELMEIRAGEEAILRVIDEHCSLLGGLADYTQRILAVCELLIFCEAASRGAALVTGHGPELFLGGFTRRAAPSMDEPETIIERARLNLFRLEQVARATDCRLILPYLTSPMIEIMAALRRSGGTKDDLSACVAGASPRPKASLQNGSGVHYLFARLARRAGCEYVRDFMEELIA